MQKARRRIGRPPLSGPEALGNPLNAKSVEERRALFMEAAARLFGSKGYASTSIRDLTEEIGLSQGIFYYYWKDKKEILLEIHARAIALLNERLDRVLETTPEDRLEAAIRGHVEVALANRSLVTILSGEPAQSEETVGERRAYTDRFQRLVQEGTSAGIVRDDDPRIMTLAILGLCNSVGMWYKPEGKLSIEEITGIIARFARNGYEVR
jgi:AcrR family transcriptional regulator